jgi:hypothetical protein
VSSTQYDRYKCGPLEILVAAETGTLRRKIADTLDLYNVEWTEPLTQWQIEIGETDNTIQLGPGEYLQCARMHVELSGDQRLATCPSGAQAACDPHTRRWTMLVPRASIDPWVLTDIESLLSLVLTEGWREAGWVPLHAGAVVLNDTCALICAASGGGKTSLTAALVRVGWKTLGDDKLLLRIGADGAPELRGLVHTFNLHPRTRSWFPEVGDLEQLPSYSDWTEKRKVHPETIWPGSTTTAAVPNVLFHLSGRSTHGDRSSRTRSAVSDPLHLSDPLSAASVLSILLHQTVVPSHAPTARPILATIARTARNLVGFRVDIDEDAYMLPTCLSPLESAITSTLSTTEA